MSIVFWAMVLCTDKVCIQDFNKFKSKEECEQALQKIPNDYKKHTTCMMFKKKAE